MKNTTKRKIVFRNVIIMIVILGSIITMFVGDMNRVIAETIKISTEEDGIDKLYLSLNALNDNNIGYKYNNEGDEKIWSIISHDENGNKAWKLVPKQTTTAATSINIPALNHATNMENQEVTVSFLVKVDGTFTSAAGWGTLLFEKTSTTTTIVSQELVSGTNLVDGVYKITLKTKLSYDSGTKNYRISNFKFTTYGSAIDANDPVSLYIDNIVLSLA